MHEWMADMTTTLTVNTAEVENKTNITCQTLMFSNSTFLYIVSQGSIELHNYNLKSPMCNNYYYLVYCKYALPE